MHRFWSEEILDSGEVDNREQRPRLCSAIIRVQHEIFSARVEGVFATACTRRDGRRMKINRSEKNRGDPRITGGFTKWLIPDVFLFASSYTIRRLLSKIVSSCAAGEYDAVLDKILTAW